MPEKAVCLFRTKRSFMGLSEGPLMFDVFHCPTWGPRVVSSGLEQDLQRSPKRHERFYGLVGGV